MICFCQVAREMPVAVIVAHLLVSVSAAEEPPKKYTLDYPTVTRIFPPVRSTFSEVTRTTERVNGKTFRHPLNGGFGYKLNNPAAGKDMIHLGADLGWFRIGEPVFAIAEGVVRASSPPIMAEAKKAGKKPNLPPGAMLWGNLIVIEHKLKNGAYVTTIYGHLGSRLVKPGDIVKPGQQIGTIGKQSVYINGGYKPHLHFGVAYGRLLEKGRTLFVIRQGAKQIPINVVDFTPETVTLEFNGLQNAENFYATFGEKKYRVETNDGKLTMPAQMIWSMRIPSFPVIGYADSTEGWLDPVAFLRKPDSVKPGKPSGKDIKQAVTLKVYDVLGKPAPSWGVKEWANLPDGKKTLDAADFKGRIVAIFCFQAGCPRCRKYGLANWRKVIAHYAKEPDINFVAVQTADEKFSVNTFARAKMLARQHRLDIPIGHDGSRDAKPAFMVDYGVNTTPWMIVLDTQGRVRVNVVMPNPESCINLIELVKKLSKGN